MTTFFEECDLLVCSTDKFVQEAEVTVGQLKRLGIASLFDCYALFGEQRPSFEGFRVLNRRAPGTWSSELSDGLMALKKRYVLLWLGDLIPLRIDRFDALAALISRFLCHQGNYLRLNPVPPGHGDEVLPGLREILPGEIYRTATVYAVWRRELLLSLLRSDETAWQFELAGSVRSDSFGAFYASTSELIHFVNLVVKGLVDPIAERIVAAHGVPVDHLQRPRMNGLQLATHRFNRARARALRFVPWQMRRAIRNRFSINPRTRV